jgi:hypothetical protein
VFTGLFDLKKPGKYPYLVIWRSGNDGGLRRGKPPAKLLRGEVGFEELPGRCGGRFWRRTGRCGG